MRSPIRSFYKQVKLINLFADKSSVSLQISIPRVMREIEKEDIVILVFTLDSIVKITDNRCRHFGQEVNHYQEFKNLEQNRISLVETRDVYPACNIPLEGSMNTDHKVVFQRISIFPSLVTFYTFRRHYYNVKLIIFS